MDENKGILNRYFAWEEQQRTHQPALSAVRWTLHGALFWLLLIWAGVF